MRRVSDKGARGPSPADAAYGRIREVCLAFSGAEEKLSHGAPAFHVRGKLFLTFVDDHHRDGRLAVWCKATHEDQRRLVDGNPSRFFVPPYVGVKGWVGVNVDPANADWIELAILVEEAWRSVAPARIVQKPLREIRRLPPPARVVTDDAVAGRALERLTAICLALPGAERERESRHATFRVAGKVFAYFLDNHHGDGAVVACVKGDKREHARLVTSHPARYSAPAYIGPRGYLGIRLDLGRRTDWDDVERRVRASYASVVPRRAAKRDARRH